MHIPALIAGCCLLLFVSGQKKDSLIKNMLAEPEDIQVVFTEDGDAKGALGFVPSPLHASKELLHTAISFRFAAARYSYRGLDPRSFSVRINGIKMNRLYDQQIPWNDWGGLNESITNQNVFAGVGELGFGNIGMNNHILIDAATMRVQQTVTFVHSNRAYGNRLAYVKANGYNKKNWATIFQFSGRKGDEQIMEGGFYKSGSYLFALQKKLSFGTLQFLIIGAALQRNTSPATTNEYRFLGGRKTNPYWGYQQGIQRNVGSFFNHQPKIMINGTATPNENITINMACMYGQGSQYTTGFDWYNASDPRADYYRYLPSYQQDSLMRAQVEEQILTNPASLQIQWGRLYNINRNNPLTINGITGNRAVYIIESRVKHTKQFVFAASLQEQITATDSWKMGIDISQENSRQNKVVDDLLGGDYYVNWNQFANTNGIDRSVMQNDLNLPDRILYRGDIFGYDYQLRLTDITGWIGWVTRKQKVDIDVGGMATFSQYLRIGYMRNGLFPGNSYGSSPPTSFFNTGLKTTITYKHSGKHYFLLNVLAMSRAPLVQHVFVSARVNTLMHPSSENEKIVQVDAGWMYNSTKMKYRLNGYLFQKRAAIDLLSFYHDEYKSLVSYAISNIAQVHVGIEASLSYSLTPSIGIEIAACVGDYRFMQKQQFATFIDNETTPGDNGDIFVKNFKVPGTPQQAFTTGITYKPGRWWTSFAISYLRDYWLDVNPIRRTYSAGLYQLQTNTGWIFPQEKLPSILYADAFIGTSMYLRKHKQLPVQIFLSVNNCFNNLFYSGGYEQLRFGVTKTGDNKFPTKYFLAPGINYSLTTRVNL